MTADLFQLFTRYLSEPADVYHHGEDPASARRAIRSGEPLFAFVAALAEDREVGLLKLLYSGSTRLHAIIGDEADFRDDKGFADQAGAPFRKSDASAVHAMRVLAGLGLALTGDGPAEGPLRSALTWYADAQGSLAVHTWNPRAVDWGQPRLPPLMEPLARAAADESSAGAALTTALTLHELAAGAQAAPKTGRRRQASVIVLLVRSDEGVRARLQMSVAMGLPPGLVPDPRQMALFSADPGFQQSLSRAWSLAGTRPVGGTVLWSIREAEGPSPRIEGESAGAALASALDEIWRLSRPLPGLRVVRRLQGSNAIIGRIDDLGYLQGVEGYDGKLAALDEDSRVIVPAADTEKAIRAAAKGMEIVPATRWKEAASKARRRDRKVILRQGLAAALVLALIAAGVALFARDQALSERYLAASDALAAQSQASGETDPALARLEAVAAWNLDHTPNAEYAMLKAALLPAAATAANSYSLARPLALNWKNDLLAAGNAVGNGYGLIQLWNLSTHHLEATLKSNDFGGVTAAAFSPDGSLLALGTADGSVELWNVATHRRIAVLGPDSDSSDVAASVAFSPDGGLLAVGIDDGGVQLWNATTHQLEATLGHGEWPGSLAFDSDGSLLAVGIDDGGVQLWNATTHQLEATLASGHDYGNSASSVEFNSGSTLLAAGTDGGVQLWNVATHKLAAALATDDGDGVDNSDDKNNYGLSDSVEFRPDGSVVTVDPQTGDVQLWDVAAHQLEAALGSGEFNVPGSAAFSPDGRIMANSTRSGTIQLLDIAAQATVDSPSSVLRFSAYTAPDYDLAFGPNDSTLAAGTFLSGVQLWDVATAHLNATLGPATANAVETVAFSPNGRFLANSTINSQVQVWDVATRHPIATLNVGSELHGVSDSSVAFSPDSSLLAVSTVDTVQLWDATATRLHLEATLGTTGGWVAFSPDGGLLAVGDGNTVQVWDVATRHVEAMLRSEGYEVVTAVAFSPDGSLLAVDTLEGGVQLWDLATGQLKSTLGYGNSVDSMAFSTASSVYGTVLAITADNGIQLWDTTIGQLIGALPASDIFAATSKAGPATAFSRDGTLLATSTLGGSVQVRRLSYLADTPKYLCSLPGESFPPAVWAQYARGIPYQKTCP